ncbi:GAF domain-containing protein [Planomonospora parontospora]|uniref:GAF domain-containing protein n=1 Tax=Planomonospora parontospora TaxID=58119 RepID=UPI0017838703|nr:GAF domain-containing protein [Planomonospora parontospora]
MRPGAARSALVTPPRPEPPPVRRSAGRLAELHALDVLPEPSFTAIVALAAFACGAPITLVNLINATGQHFKGRYGTAAPGMDLRIAFCPHAICGRSLLEVPDAPADPRFRDDPLVSGEPYVRLYAGVPVLSHDHALGTVRVMDHRPRRLSDAQRQALATLANDAAGLLQLHHYAARTDQALVRLRRIDAVKNQSLRTVNHELLTPLASIRSSVQLVRDGDLDAATQERFLESNTIAPRAVTTCGRVSQVVRHVLSVHRPGIGWGAGPLPRARPSAGRQ